MRRLKSKRMKKISPSSDEKINIITKIVGVVAIVFLVWSQNNLLITKEFTYEIPGISSEMSGYKILHISDICNTDIDIYSKAKKANPDVIVISGGYLDKSGNYNKSVEVVNKLSSLAPVYYIYNSEDKESNTNILDAVSATNITNTKIEIQPNIDLAGLDIEISDRTESEIKNNIYDIIGNNKEKICLALTTSEESIDTISKTNVDVLFLGNTPKSENTSGYNKGYNKGVSALNGTQLFISSGIGSSKNSSQFRVMNFPELQLITLSDGTITNKSWLEKTLDKLVNEVGTLFDDTKLESYKQVY